MAYIHGAGLQPSTVTDQAVRAMPAEVRKRFKAELQLLAADAALNLLGQMGMSQAEIRKAAKSGSLKKALRKERRPVAKRSKKSKMTRAAKGAQAGITKAYTGNVTPISAAKSARTCWNGHAPGKQGARCCVWCGQQYGMTYAESTAWQVSRVLKAAKAPKTRQEYLDLMRNESDPAKAQGWWYLAYPEFDSNGGGGRSA